MKVSNSAKIMISGGHLTPALAVLSELKKQGFKTPEKPETAQRLLVTGRR